MCAKGALAGKVLDWGEAGCCGVEWYWRGFLECGFVHRWQRGISTAGADASSGQSWLPSLSTLTKLFSSVNISWVFTFNQWKDIDETHNGGSHHWHFRGWGSDQLGQVMNRWSWWLQNQFITSPAEQSIWWHNCWWWWRWWWWWSRCCWWAWPGRCEVSMLGASGCPADPSS